jgi:excisionase family DNA binding protein
MSAPVGYLTTGQLAERTGIPAETLRQWRRRGTGPAYLKLGRSIRYRLADLEAWERSCLVRPQNLN